MDKPAAIGDDEVRYTPGAVVDVVVDAAVVLFAWWTVLYQLGGLAGTGRWNLMVAWLMGAPVALWALLQRGPVRHPSAGASPSLSRGPRTLMAMVLAVVAMVFLAIEWDVLFWVAGSGAAFLAWLEVRGPVAVTHEIDVADRTPVGPVVVVMIAALAFAVVSAMQVEWVPDNSYYVDRALAVRDSQVDLPFGRDTLHAERTWASTVAENDLSSLEPGVGVVSALVGIHPMALLSYLIHPGIAALSVLALWRSARALGATRPHVVAVGGSVAVYLLSRSTEIAFVAYTSRTGRTLLVSVLVVLVLVYAVELARRPGLSSSAMLAAACIAAVGSTLTAYVAIPLVVLVGLVAVTGLRPTRQQLHWVAITAGIVVSYGALIAIAAVHLGRVVLEGAGSSAVAPGEVWQHVLGRMRVYLPLTGLFLLGWAVAPTRLARRVLAALPLVAIGVFLAPPVLWVVMRTQVASAPSRILWGLPIGLVLGFVSAGLVQRLGRAGGGIVGLVLLVGLVSIAPRLPDPGPRVPRWDVPRGRVASARTLVAQAPEGFRVLAPQPIAALVPVISTEHYAVAISEGKTLALGQLEDPRFRSEQRLTLLRMTTEGIVQGEGPEIVRWLDEFFVGSVCLAPGARTQGTASILTGAGFERVGGDARCEFWALGEESR